MALGEPSVKVVDSVKAINRLWDSAIKARWAATVQDSVEDWALHQVAQEEVDEAAVGSAV